MAAKFEINADKREGKGTGASRRLRHAGKIPGIIYGGSKDPEMVAFDHSTVYHLLEQEAFHTSVLDVKCDGSNDQAILRDVHMHPHKPLIMHMDLQRISATEKIHMEVPIHFIGEDVAPGVKLQSGIVAHLLTEVDVTCLPADLPEYLTADISKLDLGDSVHLSDLVLPEGVELTSLAHGGDDLAVATITMPKAAVEEEEELAAAEEEGVVAVAPAEEAEEAEEEEKKEGE